ncbi:MAG: nitronate monooxygenase [Candidatus Algichlamydia australiensis]|nr:nitronate monooxygenase [Chlamydiales bacterium]
MPKKELPFELKIPVIQAPMAGGHTTPELVAAVSNGGGLGSLGAGYMEPEAIREAIQKIRTLSSLPFNVNLFVPPPQTSSPPIERMQKILAKMWKELSSESFEVPSFSLPSFEEQVEVLIEEKVSIFSFTFGIPPSAILDQFRDKGIKIVGTATTPEEAQKLEKANVNAIVCQGKEAGGHRGNFSTDDPFYDLSTLLKLTKEKVSTPLIAAGGLMDGPSVAHALQQGAFAAQLGTVFLTTKESGSAPIYKKTLLQKPPLSTVITKAFTGKNARAVSNDFINRLKGSAVPEYPIQHFLTKKLRTLATEKEKVDLMSIWAGENYPQCQDLTVAELLSKIIDNL